MEKNNQEEKSNCQALAEAIHAITHWDLVLFLEPTVEFVQDGTRSEEIAQNREKYSNQIMDLLHRYSRQVEHSADNLQKLHTILTKTVI